MTVELFTALAAANSEIKNPKKTARGAFGAYATLDAYLDALRPVYAAHGLSIVQDVTDDDERVFVTTRIVHASGAEIVCGPMSSPRGQNIQHAGAAVTYLRRFTLGAATGLAGEDDDDGQTHAQEVKNDPKKSGSRAVRSEARASEKQVAFLTRLMREAGVNEVILNDFAKDRFGWELPADGIAHLTAVHASDLIDAMTKEKKSDAAKTSRQKVAGRDYTPDGSRDGSPTYTGPEDPWAGPLVDPFTGEEVAQ